MGDCFDVQLVGVGVDSQTATPKHRQIYAALCEAVLADRLHTGDALPSSRALARKLGVSRNTVVAAYQQLLAEGYLVGRVGSGTFVASQAKYERPAQSPVLTLDAASPAESPRLAPSAILVQELHSRRPCPIAPPRPFQVTATPIDQFPVGTWGRLISRRLRTLPHTFLSEREPLGYRPLREAVARHLRNTRAVNCGADQIAIVSGANSAIFTCALILIASNDVVWMEEPGYSAARGSFQLRTERVVAVPVDAEGLDVDAGSRQAPQPRLIYTTPSHQFPLGSTMTLRRRLNLLRAADEAKAWIIEDDYDSELRYDGHPVASLQGLDRSQRVIYVGSFNTILFAGLRIAYVVLPQTLVEPFAAARWFIDEHSAAINQVVLTDFLDEGHFGRYVHKARAVCAERQEYLLAQLERKCGQFIRVEPSPAGAFLVADFPADCDDVGLAVALGNAGIDVLPLSPFFSGVATRRGLLLGYAASDIASIRAGVDTLSRVVTRISR